MAERCEVVNGMANAVEEIVVTPVNRGQAYFYVTRRGEVGVSCDPNARTKKRDPVVAAYLFSRNTAKIVRDAYWVAAVNNKGKVNAVQFGAVAVEVNDGGRLSEWMADIVEGADTKIDEYWRVHKCVESVLRERMRQRKQAEVCEETEYVEADGSDDKCADIIEVTEEAMDVVADMKDIWHRASAEERVEFMTWLVSGTDCR